MLIHPIRSLCRRLATSVALIPLAGFFLLAAELHAFTIDASKPAGKVSPLHYGLMTEEINHCYDGGLYAELVQNRAFLDDAGKPDHWSVVAYGGSEARIALDSAQPLNDKIKTSLRLDVSKAAKGKPAGVANEGYWGIPVQPETTYRASLFAKAADGFAGPITLSIQSADGSTVFAKGRIDSITPEWARYEVTLQTGKVAPTTEARYAVTVDQPGTVWLSLVSLFPPTWNDRPNGLRKDLMQMLVDLKPRFLRFPGGNYLEGDRIDTRFKWWETLGPLSERPGHPCPWGYRSTDGMGLLEFLLWCEDMGAEPVLGLYAGYSLKGDYVKPGPDLEPFVQEALDEIEYVTGDVNTKWGARRAKDGRPEPFKLTYVEIGNEDWFDKSGSYDGRFAQFHDAIKKKYPHLKTISSVGFEQPKNKWVHSREPDAVDEHYYRSTDEFLKMAPDHYEKYDRSGPEIFVGEWAAHEDSTIRPWSPEAKRQPPTPNMLAAIGDAAFMTAMERNSDLIVMQCYAPLFVNVNPGAYQWRPNLIGYDALRSYGSPSYHAFRMFSNFVGDEILKIEHSGSEVLASVTRNSKTGQIFVKLVNPGAKPESLHIKLNGGKSLAPTAAAITLAAEPDASNSLADPRNVVPVSSEVHGIGPSFDYTVPAHGVVVLKLRAR